MNQGSNAGMNNKVQRRHFMKWIGGAGAAAMLVEPRGVFAEALTTFGIIGVKVWIYRGEILDPNASIARGTTTDPINEVKLDRSARRGDRGPRRDRGDR